MNYTDEDKEDKKYKKGYGREEFKKDVADAVKGPPKSKRKKKRQNTCRLCTGDWPEIDQRWERWQKRLRQDGCRRAAQVAQHEEEGTPGQVRVSGWDHTAL
jgi:hypothetical protein